MGFALVFHYIAAGVRKKRNPVGRKLTFAQLDFRGSKVVDSQCGRHTPLRTPFRYIYLGVIRAKDDDLFAAGAVFCVRFHAPTVNYFRFRPGVEFAVRAVITFESAYFFSYIAEFHLLLCQKKPWQQNAATASIKSFCEHLTLYAHAASVCRRGLRTASTKGRGLM